MPQTHPRVVLLRCSPTPEEIVALGAKLCYSDADLEELEQGIQRRDQHAFLQRLTAMGHLSPIEHASFTFGIEGVSRSFMAQITRYRIASFSVKSQRYVGAKRADGFEYVVPPSIEALGPPAVEEFGRQMRQIQDWYTGWVDKLGLDNPQGYEDARFVLPNAAETKMIVTMNARELQHFFHQRCCNRAQWEIRGVAWDMLRLCKQSAPYLFESSGPACVFASCSEGKMSCGMQAQVKDQYRQRFEE